MPCQVSRSIKSSTESEQEDFNRRLNHLLKTKAFTAQNVSCKNKTVRQYAESQLKLIDKLNAGMTTFKTTQTYVQLKHASQSSHSKSEDAFNIEPESCGRISSTSSPVILKDRDGVVLGYRFRVPMDLIECLEDSEKLLPATQTSDVKRGTFSRHYALWSSYSKTPYYSASYLKEKEQAGQWFKANEKLFAVVSGRLRVMFPEMYVKASTLKRLPISFPQPPLELWHGAAIVQDMGESGGRLHWDWNDVHSVFNCVIPFGKFVGGNLFLPTAGKVVEIERGEAFFFLGRILPHRVLPVVEGSRNVVDLFIHQRTLELFEKLLEEKGIKRNYSEKVTARRMKKRMARKDVAIAVNRK